MKYLHYDEMTGQPKGFYDTQVHEQIPNPSIVLTDDYYTHLFGNQNGMMVDVITQKVFWPEPTKVEIENEKILNLNNKFIPLFDANDRAYLIANRRDDQNLIKELNDERAALESEYNAQMEVIING